MSSTTNKTAMKPDFSKIDFAPARHGAPVPAAGGAWLTNEGIAVKPYYTAADLAAMEHLALRRRASALPARAVLDDVRHAAVDHPPIRRLLHRRGVQRLLPAQSRGRAEGPFRGLRSGHAPRLRFRPPARRRRRRQGRRGHRLGRGHEDPLRRHPARPDVRLDDHERGRAARDGVLHRRRRGAGRPAGKLDGHHPERHPQGVHGPQHLHLPARALDAHHRRHLPLLVGAHAEVQLHLDLRLPHAGSGRHGGPRAGLHAGRRPRIPAHRR